MHSAFLRVIVCTFGVYNLVKTMFLWQGGDGGGGGGSVVLKVLLRPKIYSTFSLYFKTI